MRAWQVKKDKSGDYNDKKMHNLREKQACRKNVDQKRSSQEKRRNRQQDSPRHQKVLPRQPAKSNNIDQKPQKNGLRLRQMYQSRQDQESLSIFSVRL
jgi:hypothetical protein